MEPLAKPYDITLAQHVRNLQCEGRDLHTAFPFVYEKYNRLTGCSLSTLLEQAIQWHDEGKKDERWQSACRKDYDSGRKTGYLNKTGIRHEIESLIMTESKQLPPEVKVAIAAHHNKFSINHEKRWEEQAPNLWSSFKKMGNAFRKQTPLETFIHEGIKYDAVRAFLRLADHRASAKEQDDNPPDFKKFDFTFPEEWVRKPVQALAEAHWQEEMLMLRAPTGSGKTMASLLWANKQIEAKRADRLVIAMPTRFTSNALAVSIDESISERGLYHSSARFAENVGKEVLEYARLLLTPVTVCTIDHLLIAISKTREDHHDICFNLSNSCVVIDEADFYDDFTQANLEVLLRCLKSLEVPVMLMSATLPEISLQRYRKTGYSINQIHEDTSDLERIRCKIASIRSYDNPTKARSKEQPGEDEEALEQHKDFEEIADLLERCMHEPAIIYANTIDKALAFHQWFVERDVQPMLYHSRFIEEHKKQKENELVDALGYEAWNKGEAQGLAILTQIGEMSVNISADLMLTELCPIDRLVQRAGRLSRFSKTVGELHILKPQKDGVLYPAPYGTLAKGTGWTPAEALTRTQECIELGPYSAAHFNQLVNQVYDKLPEKDSITRRNIQNYHDCIKNNWLIVPKHDPREDEEENEQWKSRAIGAQISVLVEDPTKVKQEGRPTFSNYSAYRRFINEYGISIPLWLFEKHFKRNSNGEGGLIEKREVTIGWSYDRESVYLAPAVCYNHSTGLDFSNVKKKQVDDSFL